MKAQRTFNGTTVSLSGNLIILRGDYMSNYGTIFEDGSISLEWDALLTPEIESWIRKKLREEMEAAK